MADTVYALLVRDMASGIDREKLDDALAGVITLGTPEDDIDPFATGADRFPDRIPPMSETMPRPVIPRYASKEELAKTWGQLPQHRAHNQMFEQMTRNVPPQKKP